MTLDDDSAIVTVPPSPPESRLLVGRAAQWRAIPTRWRRHPPPARTVYKECAFGSDGSPPPRPRRSRSPTDPVASGGRWGHSRISRSVLRTKRRYDLQIYAVGGGGALLPSGGFACCERRSQRARALTRK